MNSALQQDIAKLILRVTLGALILLHGVGKLNGGVAAITTLVGAHGLPPALGYAVLVGEVIAPLMLLLGFYARIGAVLIASNMVVAILLVHMGQLTSLNAQGGWQLELQAMYLVSALALALLGPGRFSVNGR